MRPKAWGPLPNFPTSHLFLHKSPYSRDFLSGARSVGPVAKFSYFSSFFPQNASLRRFFRWGPNRGARSLIFPLLRIIFNKNHLTHDFLSGARGVGPEAKLSYSFASFFTQITSLRRFFKWGPKRGARSLIFPLLRIIFNANHITQTIF